MAVMAAQVRFRVFGWKTLAIWANANAGLRKTLALTFGRVLIYPLDNQIVSSFTYGGDADKK